LTGRTGIPKLHLEQRVLNRPLTPPIALDNRRLERLPTKLRHLQAPRWPRSAACAHSTPARLSRRDALCPNAGRCTADPPPRQKRVQHLLHAAPQHPVEVLLGSPAVPACTKNCSHRGRRSACENDQKPHPSGLRFARALAPARQPTRIVETFVFLITNYDHKRETSFLSPRFNGTWRFYVARL
jgi:hypothetical protein